MVNEILNAEFIERSISAAILIFIAGISLYFGMFMLIPLAAIIFIAAVYELLGEHVRAKNTDPLLISVFSIILICISLYSILSIRTYSGVRTAVWLVCCVSATDIGAYFVGNLLKGPKLCEQISPKKTWSGFFGGIFCAALIGWIFSFFIALPFSFPLIMSAFIGILAAWGDLLESLLKRYLNIKDFGGIIPGHGGIVDRIDSLIPPSIFIWLIQ